MRRVLAPPLRAITCTLLTVVAFLYPTLTQAQGESGSVRGRVTLQSSGEPLTGVIVLVGGTRLRAVTDADGRYSLAQVPVGRQTLRFEWAGFGSRHASADVTAGATVTLDQALEPAPTRLGEVLVTAASRQPERVIDAPMAVSGVEAARIRDLAIASQAPLLLAGQPGVQVVQSGTNDFNLNARGFNGPLNRRVLVLVDGRDVSIPILGNQEWPSVVLDEDATRMEFVRGPASALYGANAFNGILDIVTPAVRESQGIRLSVAGGEWGSRQVAGRYGVVSPSQQWGWRTNVGYSVTDGFDRARTELGYLEREYRGAVDAAQYPIKVPVPGYELRPLNGQTKEGPFGLPGRAVGDPDPQSNVYASTRVDYYARNGGELTAEGGFSQARNQVFTTTSGRSQTVEASRPWARLNWRTPGSWVTAWYSGRDGSTYGLNPGVLSRETSGTLHLEAQVNRRFAGERGRYVLGASTRRQFLDSQGSLFAPQHDGRADGYHALFGQAEYDLVPRLRLVVASRLDEGSLIDAQFSPRAALIYSPRSGQSLRVTANRAYLTPAALERFIRFPAGPPLDFSALEAGLRASPLGPALAGVPAGALFTDSRAVPLLILGNEALQPQFEKSYEVGYKGQWDDRLFVAANVWQSDIRDFLTGAFPGVFAPYGNWTSPAAVPEVARGALEAAVAGAVGRGLTRLEDGSTVFGVSLTTAGRVTERGADVALGARVHPALRLDANYAWYDFNIRQSTFLPGDSILPNTPRHVANVGATWMRGNRLRLHANLALLSAFDWRTGFYRGRVPARQTVDVDASYPLSDRVRLTFVGTNLFDQRRYQMFGGTVIPRRVMVGATWQR